MNQPHNGGMDQGDLSNCLGALNIHEMLSPQSPSNPMSMSQSHTPANGYPVMAPRLMDQPIYQDYGQQVFYTPANVSNLPLDSPYSPMPQQTSFGYGTHPPEAVQAGGYDATFIGGTMATSSDGNLYGLGLGLNNEGPRDVFPPPPRNTFRPSDLPANGSSYYGYQQQDARYYGLQQAPQQEQKPLWMTPQGMWVEREPKKGNVRQQFATSMASAPPTPLRYNHGPRSPTYPTSEFVGSPINRAYPQTPGSGPLSHGHVRGWQNGRNHGANTYATPQSPAQHGAPFQQNPYTWNPYAAMNHPYGIRSPRRDHGIHRSALLEDFRLNKSNKRWDIHDILGHILEFSGDQHGSRFIQQKFEAASLEDKKVIFDEIMPNAYALMTDVFGNYVIQKVFEQGDQYQKAALGREMEGKILNLSMQMYGCRVVQKSLDHLYKDQRESLIGELKGHVVECVKSSNANHVVQKIIQDKLHGPPKFLLDAFTGHVEELSCNPYGCRVLQKTFECLDETMKRPLLGELHRCADKLIEDQFGNYVVQSIITSCDASDKAKVFAKIKPDILHLCRQKFASNVVEKALQHSEPDEREGLVETLLGAGDSDRIALLLRDPYGNFPVQTALVHAQDDQKQRLYDIIVGILPSIRATPVGKRLELRIAEMQKEGAIDDSITDRSGSPTISAANERHPLGSSVGTDGSEMSRSNSSSTRVTSPGTEGRIKVGSLRPTSSAPPGVLKGDPVKDAAQALHDLLH